MNKSIVVFLFTTACVLTASQSAMADVTLTKAPDIGPYWQPLNANTGTYVYADSFVAPASGTVTNLGTWLTDQGGGFPPAAQIRFEVLGSLGGNAANGPDITSVLANTTALGPFTGPLTLYTSAPLGGGTPLVGGQTYWFAASNIGLSDPNLNGQYQTGGHTQNSGSINDNGTFWYSNNPNGTFFDGQGLTPELAFTVSIASGTVPEPTAFAAWSLLGLCAGAYAWRRRRKSA
jgi:hypothetical protein